MRWPLCGGRRPWLIRLEHGVGDAVMATTVLLHLRQAGQVVDVWCAYGQHSLFPGLCRRVYLFGADRPDARQYARVIRLPCWEPGECYADSPATKAEVMLRHLFRQRPREALCRYEIHSPAEAIARARQRLQALAGGRRVLLMHYQGNSGAPAKDLAEGVIAATCRVALEAGFAPVVLDQHGTSQAARHNLAAALTAGDPLWRGCGFDGGLIAALARGADVCLGIDSGPGHIFAAANLGTPTIIVWPGVTLHPLHYFAPAAHVVHLLAPGHEEGIQGERGVGLDYFRRRYRHVVCRRHYREELPGLVAGTLAAS